MARNPNNRPPQPQGNQQGAGANANPPRRWFGWRGALELFFTFVIALSTCAYAYFSYGQGGQMGLQLNAMQGQVDALKDSNAAFVSLQRPFLSIPVVQLNPSGPTLGGPTTGLVVTPTIQNSGNTRAKEVYTRFNFWYSGQNRMPQNYTFTDIIGQEDNSAKLFLGPHSSIGGSPFAITKEKVAEIRAGTDHLYVYGRIAYDDIFPTSPRHVTEFCFYLVGILGDTDIVGAPMSVNWSLCPHHNCADDECKPEQHP